MKNRRLSGKYIAAILCIFTLAALPALVSAGTISSTDKYAWSDKLGWINFAPDNGGVKVTDSSLSGYVWSANAGWINLAPDNGGVLNNKGTLSGKAWGSNTGWIDFTGVSIDSNGLFNGTANGDVSGTINFSCTTCSVKTDWRPTVTSFAYVIPPPDAVYSFHMSSSGSRIPTTLTTPPLPTGGVIQSNSAGAAALSKTVLASTFNRDLQVGQTGFDVKTLQKYLNANGYVIAKSGPGSPGHETDTFGALTKKALAKFQRDHGIPATGYFGPITRKYLTK